jgi:hypothetical protein
MKKKLKKINRLNEKNPKNDFVTKKHFDSEIKIIKSDISVLKVDVANIKYDMSEVKDYMQVFSERQEKMITLLDKQVKSTEDLKDEYHIIKAEIVQVKKVIRDEHGIEIKVI